jgi:hypothetical protein
MFMTIFQIKTVLGRRIGPLVALADLDDAIALALRSLGIAPANPIAANDGDLTVLVPSQLDQLYDVAEWRALETVLGNCTGDELRRVGVSEDVDRVRTTLRQRIDRQYARVRAMYHFGLPVLQVGVLALGSQQQDTETTINY